MTGSDENVSALPRQEEGWQGPCLLVAGGDGADTQWAAAANAVLSGRTERLRTGALAENHRGFQRAGRDAATETFSLGRGTPADDPQVARVLLNQVRLERTRQFG